MLIPLKHMIYKESDCRWKPYTSPIIVYQTSTNVWDIISSENIVEASWLLILHNMIFLTGKQGIFIQISGQPTPTQHWDMDINIYGSNQLYSEYTGLSPWEINQYVHMQVSLGSSPNHCLHKQASTTSFHIDVYQTQSYRPHIEPLPVETMSSRLQLI